MKPVFFLAPSFFCLHKEGIDLVFFLGIKIAFTSEIFNLHNQYKTQNLNVIFSILKISLYCKTN